MTTTEGPENLHASASDSALRQLLLHAVLDVLKDVSSTRDVPHVDAIAARGHGPGAVTARAQRARPSSIDEYAWLLSVAYHRGNGTVGTPELFDLQSIEPYPNAEIGSSPVQALGYSYRYGLTAWLECSTPADGCAVFSSPGAYGFTPWIDREHRYYAMLAMEITSTGAVVAFAVELEQAVQPLIVEALQR